MVKKVRVDGIDYEVVRTDKPIIFEKKASFGMIDYDNKKIYISTEDGTEASRHYVLYHELIHAIAHERNIIYGEAGAELYIDEISKGVFNMVQDNPELVNAKHWKGK